MAESRGPDDEPVDDGWADTRAGQEMRQLFADHPEPSLDLVAGVISSLADPSPSPKVVVSALDQLADSASSSVDDASELMRLLFTDLGFHGNRDDYYNPDNSYLHLVIQRRLGIPITLSVLSIEVGRRLGIELTPVGFPGHFLLGDANAPERFFDPFSGGNELLVEDCAAMLQRMYPGARLEPAHTAELSVAQITHRMLNNLKQIHLSRGDLSAVVEVASIGVALPGADIAIHAELAKLLEASGRFDRAALIHERMAELDAANAQDHRRMADALRFSRN